MTSSTLLAVHGYGVSRDPAAAVEAAFALSDVAIGDVAVLIAEAVEQLMVPEWWSSVASSGRPRLTMPDIQPVSATLSDAAALLRDQSCPAVLVVSPEAALLVALPDPARRALACVASSTEPEGAVARLAERSGIELEDVGQLRVADPARIPLVVGQLAAGNRTCVLGEAWEDEVACLAATVADLHRAVLPATSPTLREEVGELPEPLCITVSAQPWARRNRDGSRAAVVVTDTAVHLVAGTCPAGDRLPLDWFGCGGPVMLILQADSGTGLQEAASVVHDELAAGADLIDLSRHYGRKPFGENRLRAVFLASDTAGMLTELQAAQRHLAARVAAGEAWATPSGSFCTPDVIDPGAKVALVYPGTFAMYPGAEAGLCELFPTLLAGVERVESRPYHALAIEDSYLRAARSPSAEEIAEHAAALNSDVGFTSAAGVYFGLLSTPLVRLLGIEPHGAFGYSLGEICMLWGMNVWETSEEIGRSVRNSALFTSELYGERSAVREEWDLPDVEQVWQTLALAASAERVREAVAEHDRVFVTHVNTPDEIVIAGDPTQCQQVATQIDCPHFPLPGGGPVLHVPIAARARDTILAVTDHRLSPAGAEHELFFASGRPVDLTDGNDIAESVLELCYSEVNFPQLCQRAHDAGFRYFIEVGPGADCTRWISTNLRGRQHMAVSIDQRAMPTAVGIARALAKLISAGMRVSIPYLGEVATDAAMAEFAPSVLTADEDVLQIADHELAELTAVSAVQVADVYAIEPVVVSAAPTPITQLPRRLPERPTAPAAPVLLESVSAIAAGVARAHIAALDAQSALQHRAMDALLGDGARPSAVRPTVELGPSLGPWAQVLRTVETHAGSDGPLSWNGLHLTWHGRPQAIVGPPRAELTLRASGSGGDISIGGTVDIDGAALVDVDGSGWASKKSCPVPPDPAPRSARGARGRGFKPIERTPLTSLTGTQIAALARGEVPAVYGTRWQQTAGANSCIRVADGKASLLSSVESIDIRGGPMGLGTLRGERRLSAADRTAATSVPTLALDAAEQLLRIYTVHLGLHLVFNDAELVPAEAIPLIISSGATSVDQIDGLVLETVVVEITMVPRPTVIADINVYADGERIVTLQGAAVQVRERPGSTFRPELRAGRPVYLGRCNSHGEPVWLNEFHLGHMENGELGVAMGPLFDSYTGKTLLYIPNSEFRLVDRINAVKDADASLRGGSLTIEYDVHPDTWFFQDNSFDGIPASMVMESSLQAAAVTGVCMGTTTIAPPEEKLSVRNLDGTATFLTDIDPRGKTWVQETTLLSTTQVLGQVLQRFKYRIVIDDVPYYEGTSLFGYFTDQALASQVGLDGGTEVPRWIDEQDRRSMPDVVDLDLTDPGLRLHPTLRQGTGYLDLVDHVTLVKGGGRHGLGYLAGERRVSPDDWYFQCHFHTDPVMPGSLGVEAVQQGLQIYALAAGLADGPDCTFAVPTGVPFSWTYRGQILRDEPELSFELDVTEIRETATGLQVLADASVFKPGMRIYHFTGVALEIRGARSSH